VFRKKGKDTGRGPEARSKLIRTAKIGAAVLLSALIFAFCAFKTWQRLGAGKAAPIIGVSFDTAWHGRAGLSTVFYEIALVREGARLLVLHPEVDRPAEVLRKVQGLLLAGGADVQRRLYGRRPDPKAVTDPERDRLELPLVRSAFKLNIPLLGICRGIQVINVAMGGTLKDLRGDLKLYAVHGVTSRSFEAHSVSVTPGTMLCRLIGPGPHQVNSFHGQAVDRLGKGLRVSAAAPDGIIEAVEAPGKRFLLGFQWHPELLASQEIIFKAFVKAARAYRRHK